MKRTVCAGPCPLRIYAKEVMLAFQFLKGVLEFRNSRNYKTDTAGAETNESQDFHSDERDMS